MVYVEWVPKGFTCEITLVDGHPGTEESEELRVTIASSAAIAIWALA